MFSRIAAFTALVLPLLAAATPMETRNEPASVCSTGEAQCCQSTEAANSAAGSALLSSIGVVLQDVDVLLGLDCSPISVVGVGNSGSCDATAVCCEDNSHGNLVSIGCVPVTI